MGGWIVILVFVVFTACWVADGCQQSSGRPDVSPAGRKAWE